MWPTTFWENDDSLPNRRMRGDLKGLEAHLVLDQKLHTLDRSSSSFRYRCRYTTHCVESLVTILISLSAGLVGEGDLA